MKKFIGKLLIYVLMVALVILSVNMIYLTLTKEERAYLDRFDDIPESLDICNLGSSHGYYGYDYEDINDKYNCFNFALESQTLSYDERIFNAYKEHIGQGTIVYINISYFSFFGISEEESADFESKNKRYYSILPAKQIKNYSVKNKVLYDLIPVLGVDPGLMVDRLLGEELEEKVDWDAVASDIDVATNAKKAYERHLVEGKLDESGERIVNQEEIQALYSIIDQCKKIGARPILVTTPFLAEYTDEVKNNLPDFYGIFYCLINDVIDHTGVDYYDYAFDERFVGRYDLFINADHLNRIGAKKFVDILVSETIE